MMQPNVRAFLHARPSGHFPLSKPRLETLAFLLIGLVSGRTVNLSHAVCHLTGGKLRASRYWRSPAVLPVRPPRPGGGGAPDHGNAETPPSRAPGARPDQLADRHQGRQHPGSGGGDAALPSARDVDLAPHRGSRSTDQRVALMERYLAAFGAASIQWLLADREFIGARWLAFLNDSEVRFAVRARSRKTGPGRGSPSCATGALSAPSPSSTVAFPTPPSPCGSPPGGSRAGNG
jgi:hypothetical protein